MCAVRFILIIIAYFITTSLGYALTYGGMLCKESNTYNCHAVKRGESWTSLFPDPDLRELVMKLNRMNTHLHSGMHIAIPKDEENVDIMSYAPFPKEISSPGTKLILVSLSPKVQAWGAYDENGVLQNWGPVSGGRDYCPDIHRGCHTKVGKFAIYRKEGAGCVSTKFPVGRGGAPMPYCMFFNGGFALHGSYEVPGYNASHGCVRMFVPDAQWINQEFIEDEDHVPVIISNQA